jgi:hypothetical protein
MTNNRPVRSQAREARNEAQPGLRFNYKGKSYLIPDQDDWEIELLEAMDEAQSSNPLAVVRVVKYLLGDEEWVAFKQRHPKAKELEGFMKAAMDAVGKNAGEDNPN